MHRCFELSLDDSFLHQDWHYEGLKVLEESKTAVRQSLRTFLNASGRIDAGAVKDHWFPQINADVFISHSHQDEQLAIKLAGWLSKQFGLKPFVDSCVWGYSDELLKQIDDTYCSSGPGSYIYELRNGSTSHVHVMLLSALAEMIDRCEALFFLNTPNSISSAESKKNTGSPWIFSEISLTKVIRRQTPAAHRAGFDKLASLVVEKRRDLAVIYELDTSGFSYIDATTLESWEASARGYDGHSLDLLYQVAPR
jgi:hypothetical protein